MAKKDLRVLRATKAERAERAESSLAQALTSSKLGCARCKSSSKLGFRSLAQAFTFQFSVFTFPF